MFDIEATKKTLADVETQLRELETTKAVLRRMLAGTQVSSNRKPKERKNTYRHLMTKIMKDDGPHLTTTELANRLTKIKGKKVSVTAVRMALHRERDVFEKVDTRQWGLKKRLGEKK